MWGPAHGPLRMSEIVSERRLRRSEYYRDFLRPAGIQDRLRVWLWRSPESAACVTFTRSDARFSTRDDSGVGRAPAPPRSTPRARARVARFPRRGGPHDPRVSVITMAATGRPNAEIAAAPVHVDRHGRQAPRTRLSQAYVVGGPKLPRRCEQDSPSRRLHGIRERRGQSRATGRAQGLPLDS